MPATGDKPTSYLKLKHLMCQFLLSSGESSKVWQAVQEAGDLIDYLNICYEFHQFQYGASSVPEGLASDVKDAQMLLTKSCKIMRSFFAPKAKLDPAIGRHRGGC